MKKIIFMAISFFCVVVFNSAVAIEQGDTEFIDFEGQIAEGGSLFHRFKREGEEVLLPPGAPNSILEQLAELLACGRICGIVDQGIQSGNPEWNELREAWGNLRAYCNDVPGAFTPKFCKSY